MPTTSTWIGLKEANRALKALPDFAKPEAQRVMDATGSAVARGAAARVRRRTGFLAARIVWQSRPRTVSAVAGVTPEAFYWKFLEYGTVHMDAAPFFRPAADAEQDRHQRLLVEALERANRRMEQAAAIGARFL